MSPADSPTPDMTHPTMSAPSPVSGRRLVWMPERNRQQGLVVAAICRQAAGVPCDRSAVMAGGLPGADKAAALAADGIEPGSYLTVSVNAVLLQMAETGMIPAVDGLSPMEAAGLAHAEARYVLKRIALRAVADGRNLIFDILLADAGAIDTWMGTLRHHRYTISGTYIDITAEESLRRTAAGHRHGQEELRLGRGYGGRFIPPAAIEALVSGDLLAAAPAVDDPESVIGDLYEQVVLAYDQGQISDAAYADFVSGGIRPAA